MADLDSDLELHDLRERIARIDRAIVSLTAARLRLAQCFGNSP